MKNVINLLLLHYLPYHPDKASFVVHMELKD
jgi:hypothetical protein